MSDQVRRVCVQIAILLGLTLIAAAATKAFHPKAPAWRLSAAASAALVDEFQVTMDEIKERWGGDVLWVDARTQDEFDAGHVEDALYLGDNVMHTITPLALDTVMAERRPIVVYCDGAQCAKSKKTAGELRELLGKEIFHLKGGWAELKP